MFAIFYFLGYFSSWNLHARDASASENTNDTMWHAFAPRLATEAHASKKTSLAHDAAGPPNGKSKRENHEPARLLDC